MDQTSKFEGEYQNEYKKLNPAQKEAVDTIDGPVMVVAGPGTGKTQILALRIGHILLETDTKADGILCLTFTNAAVAEMKKRLECYIGQAANEVNVHTFHSFGLRVIEEHFKVLGFEEKPKLLEDNDRAIFFEQILRENEWEHLRPRGNAMRYYEDLKSLISLFKKERIGVKNFEKMLAKEIKSIKKDEASVSTRGESKGELKKEVLKQIEGLERSMEVARFISLYEQSKKEQNLLDYDDVLESLVKIVENSVAAAASIRERYLYVLVDEHQDSSRVQNEFLTHVWAGLERPDIFVVGDDRQLIYGFSGASIEHFAGFKKNFPDAKLITLVDNYRSTQVILDASHALLQSVMSDRKLVSHHKEKHPIRLIEADNPEAEILLAGSDIKSRLQGVADPRFTSGEKIKNGLPPSECAILVPKNKQARAALHILHELGVPVRAEETVGLFDADDMRAFLRVLKILADGDAASLALSFFDKISDIPPVAAYKFIAGERMKEFSFEKLLSAPRGLFISGGQAEQWIEKLIQWKKDLKNHDLPSLLKAIGGELFKREKKEIELVSGEEILNTILALLARETEENPDITLSQFVAYLDKLKSFSEYIPLLSSPKEGVRVLTMHNSKGREFDYVWIAHLTERSLAGGRRGGFVLPESIGSKVEERDIDAIKRKLYVAITRAKRFCTLSYATLSGGESEQELARVIADLPAEVFKKEKIKVPPKIKKAKNNQLAEISELVAKKYKERYVSASLLNNFFECPWKWYFNNLLQLPEPPNEHFIFGNKIHQMIDKILKNDKKPTGKEILALAEGDKEAAKVVAQWVANRLPEILPDRQNEQPVSFSDPKFPGLNFFGRIDLIEKLPARHAEANHAGGDAQNLPDRMNSAVRAGVRVTDFKTGGAKKKNDIEKMNEEGRMSNLLRQLAMYSYLLENSPKWKVAVKESRLEFLEAKPARNAAHNAARPHDSLQRVGQAGGNPKESFYDRVISPDEINLLIKDIADYDNLVKKGEWINRPCHYNSYGQNTECEYCKMAEIYK